MLWLNHLIRFSDQIIWSKFADQTIWSKVNSDHIIWSKWSGQIFFLKKTLFIFDQLIWIGKNREYCTVFLLFSTSSDQIILKYSLDKFRFLTTVLDRMYQPWSFYLINKNSLLILVDQKIWSTYKSHRECNVSTSAEGRKKIYFWSEIHTFAVFMVQQAWISILKESIKLC